MEQRPRVEAIRWEQEAVLILDQRRLPQEKVYLRCERVEQLAEAIRRLAIRGAPLLGIAAAYGLALAAWSAEGDLVGSLGEAADLLRGTRPTARNLFWAIERMMEKARAGAGPRELLAEAQAIHREDAETCRLIGKHGAELLPDPAVVLTICNTGSLATGGIGTALGVVRTAHARGQRVEVLACETRPLLQGARLTMWELERDGIPATLICDNMAGELMRRGRADVVIVGADRIGRNGDTANKIGTYTLAVLARHHGVPFYVAAPRSTVDPGLADGSQIPIEERDPQEVLTVRDQPLAPAGARVWNPAFDVTPAALISGIITERGVERPPL